MKNDLLLAMWDCNGLETLVNYTDLERRRTWAALKNTTDNSILMPNINAWILRAQANSQRHYEIYSFGIDETLDIDDIKTLFQENPQDIVDIIRKQGHCIYSNRASQQAKIF